MAPFVSSLDSFESRGVKAVVDHGGSGRASPFASSGEVADRDHRHQFVDVLVPTTIRPPERVRRRSRGRSYLRVGCPVTRNSRRPDTAVMCRRAHAPVPVSVMPRCVTWQGRRVRPERDRRIRGKPTTPPAVTLALDTKRPGRLDLAVAPSAAKRARGTASLRPGCSSSAAGHSDHCALIREEPPMPVNQASLYQPSRFRARRFSPRAITLIRLPARPAGSGEPQAL